MDNSSFFSIDKLVEFGLGLGIAQQMVNMMNQSMQSMYIPGSYMALSSLPPYAYAVVGGQQVGPLTASQFNEMVKEGRITKDTLVWAPGMLRWEKLESTPELLKIIAMSPPPIPGSAIK